MRNLEGDLSKVDSHVPESARRFEEALKQLWVEKDRLENSESVAIDTQNRINQIRNPIA